jgi:predicted nucleic acid-binding protein
MLSKKSTVSRVLVDSDVVLDFLDKREPFAIEAALLFNAGRTGMLQLNVSALCLSNIYYLLRKRQGHEGALQKLQLLLKFSDVLTVDKGVVIDAMHSKFSDFEDGIQHFSALKSNVVDVIVTRNTKDYRHSELPVMAPKELLQALRIS